MWQLCGRYPERAENSCLNENRTFVARKRGSNHLAGPEGGLG